MHVVNSPSTGLLNPQNPRKSRKTMTRAAGPRLANPNDIMKVHLLVERIRGEFREMPGLQLTLAQAQRLFGLDPTACRQVIEALVDASFLRWTSSGTVVQAGD